MAHICTRVLLAMRKSLYAIRACMHNSSRKLRAGSGDEETEVKGRGVLHSAISGLQVCKYALSPPCVHCRFPVAWLHPGK
ncbi:MAG: hypothetical protein MJE68_20515 [Proteobacteria bacterium]|nr:hypothetical protein [Pseudomonadota bacterium]